MAASLESSTSGVHHVATVSADDVREGSWSTSAPPPGPAVHPRTTLRAVLLLVLILALELTGFSRRAGVAWSKLAGSLATAPTASAATTPSVRSVVVVLPVGDHTDRELTLVEEEPGRWRQARCVEVDLSDCEGVGADACARYDC